MCTTDEMLNYYCLGCLTHKEEKLTQSYNILNEAVKAVLEMDTLKLCYICKRIAQRCEKFIQQVKSNQIYLKNIENVSDSLIETRHNLQPLLNLSILSLDLIELADDNNLEKAVVSVYSTGWCTDNVEIKQELSPEHLDGEFIDDNDFQESIKPDDSMLADPKDENESNLDEISLRQLRKTLKKSKVKKKTIQSSKTFQEKGRKEKRDEIIKVVHVTREQCMKERTRMREDPKYKNLLYKCEDCIKGFNFKETYEKHMEAHSKLMGEYECDICKRRTRSMEKLTNHQKYHQIRYQCAECGLTRLSRLTIRDHYTAFHLHDTFQYKCSHCNKMFNRQVSLRKHMAYVQERNRKRVECKYCTKTFANADVLKGHTLLKHSTELSERSIMHHVCQECGVRFKNPSQLKMHMTKHSDRRDFYCVECDRGFKSKYALTQHLKIAAPHVNYLELKLQCEHCDKRFGIKRDLEKHLNRVHLNRRPYQCDKCDRAYVALWSLTEHKRFAHEGHQRPRKHPCPRCDKVFAQNSTLKSHILTHTGERPFACTKCPATFNQGNILRTHIKLVHLQLTRDGRPKKPAASS